MERWRRRWIWRVYREKWEVLRWSMESWGTKGTAAVAFFLDTCSQEMDGVGFDFEDDGSHDILDEEDVVQLEPLLKTGKMCLKEEGEMPLGIIHFCKRFRVGASQKIVVAEEAILAQVPFAKSCSIPFPSKLHTGKSQRSIAQSCRKELRNVVLFC
mmetsp:Transcript_4534/g.9382  ORF Transcript_4534/g.9382 Transcript_4534/m.9382 type:complete len:156 (-) Transcript_4534:861-1328(-)